jgi:hypothetical protein
VLERTDFPQSIDLDGETTAIGIIARLEHVLDRMQAEIEEQCRRVTDAKARLAGFEPRLGEVFPLKGEERSSDPWSGRIRQDCRKQSDPSLSGSAIFCDAATVPCGH